MNDNIVPIFYACDDAFVKYTIVSLQSMMDNASTAYQYQIYVLHTNISERMQQKVLEMENENFSIRFENVTIWSSSPQTCRFGIIILKPLITAYLSPICSLSTIR